ncbi:MAG: glycosyl hydrolase family 17 protein [Cryomorphaceae bacterium]
MSYRDDRVLALTNSGLRKRVGGTVSSFEETLKRGMHGIGFSPYEEGQKPGQAISEVQIRRRMEIIAPYTSWIRSFSCTEGNELIPRIAKEMGIKTLVGAWLGTDHEKNEVEIQALLTLAKDGMVDIAAVGNEVMYREDLEEAELLTHIARVKAAIPDIKVGYVDAYYEFENRPAITAACDVILSNCYPFWEGCMFEYSVLYMQDMYRRAKRAAGEKEVIIAETGWPSQGQSFHGAKPSHDSARRYFIDAQRWAHDSDIQMFYFTSFDESWKVGDEGDVGAYWGLWDKDEQLKF